MLALPTSTPSADQGGAAALALRMFLFASPLLFAALIFEIAMYRSGETLPVEAVIDEQSRMTESIFGRGLFPEQYWLYKAINLKKRRPEILVIGSSRGNQFRSFMFHPHEASFYNGSMLMTEWRDLANYLKYLRAGKLPRPRVLIVCVDYRWVAFDEKPGPHPDPYADDSGDAVYTFRSHVVAARSAVSVREVFPWWDALVGNLRSTAGYGYPSMGVNAARRNGVRSSDGSHLYSAVALEFARTGAYRDRAKPPYVARIRAGKFPGMGARVLASEVVGLAETLEALKREGIEVYAVHPPVSLQVAHEMEYSRRYGTGWKEFETLFTAELAKRGIPFECAMSPADYGLSDTAMCDGVHPGEVAISFVAEALVRKAPPGSLLAGVDLEYLAGLRKQPSVSPLFFELPSE